MKYLKILATACFLFSTMSCIVSDKPDKKYVNKDIEGYRDLKFYQVDIPMWIAKPAIKKELRKEENSEEFIALIKKVKDLKLIKVESDRLRAKEYLKKYLGKNNFEEWITVKNGKNLMSFHARNDGKEIKNFLVTINSDDELFFVDIMGKFTPEEITKIITYSEKNELSLFSQ